MILFYLVDNEILLHSRVIDRFEYELLLRRLEDLIRIILFFSPLDEFIIFSPSFLCESRIAYDLSLRCIQFIDQGFIRVYMREDNFYELRDKKADSESYGRLFTRFPDIKAAYSSKRIERISSLPIWTERKHIRVGKGSFEEFVPRIVSNAKKIDYDISEFIKRLSYSERESFLWPSVLEQSNTLSIPSQIVRDLQVRSLMNASYLDTYRTEGVLIPINTGVVSNPNFISNDFYRNTIDVNKLMSLSKALDIFDSITNMSQDNFLKLKFNPDYLSSISNIISIIHASNTPFETIDRIRKIKEDLNIKSIVSDYMLSTKKEIRINMKKKVFIVHGHDTEAKEIMARALEKGGFEPIILHEQASGGKTIMEKIEEYSDVAFAVILYTACDIGRSLKDDPMKEKFRPRQNVVFEHGYLMGKLGREKVCALVKGDIETPGDISGVVYIDMDDKKAWKMSLAKELELAGLTVNVNFYS